MNDPPSIELQGKSFILHGAPGVGKTQTVASFPEPIWWIATEFGHSYLPRSQQEFLTQIPYDETGWQFIKECCTNGIERKKKEFGEYPKTIAWDTIFRAYDITLMGVCAENSWSHPNDAGHGTGWEKLRNQLARYFGLIAAKAKAINASLVFVDHTSIETISTQFKDYHMFQPLCMGSKQTNRVIMPMPDFKWYLSYSDPVSVDDLSAVSDKRTLWLKGNRHVMATTKDPEISKLGITSIEDMPITGQYDHILATLRNAQEKA